MIRLVVCTHLMAMHQIIWDRRLDSQVGSVVGQSAKVTGSIPGGAKVLSTDGICKQFWFHPMLKYACVYCVRFVLINLQHCGQPWR